MKGEKVKCENEKKSNLVENYGLEPEMSLQNVKFATTDNKYLNEYEDEKEE
ncbi:hypothetical protein AWH56_020160 [Anaerobacillus isosaccharinicus]|uniref:Uncharacterized protein n=1 Tax=Anaerobacillus isosaccharinicus TaxID=1532552 RepID=A0A7S7L5U0_9BACI|nr:hypothetical protein [Anaerobacillus isosaccharinicus]MBA5586779.1 hypothetical protein [Anaerobacillus isosaccharinicus]QOY35003.1 hypothetical protein AWH56_020160 [Anaerobacillus isosaccharinicus]